MLKNIIKLLKNERGDIFTPVLIMGAMIAGVYVAGSAGALFGTKYYNEYEARGEEEPFVGEYRSPPPAAVRSAEPQAAAPVQDPVQAPLTNPDVPRAPVDNIPNQAR